MFRFCEEKRRSECEAFRLAREAEWSESVWTLSASPFFLFRPQVKLAGGFFARLQDKRPKPLAGYITCPTSSRQSPAPRVCREQRGMTVSVDEAAQARPHLTNPKHRFGFGRKNGEADAQFSASAGNGAERARSDVILSTCCRSRFCGSPRRSGARRPWWPSSRRTRAGSAGRRCRRSRAA